MCSGGYRSDKNSRSSSQSRHSKRERQRSPAFSRSRTRSPSPYIRSLMSPNVKKQTTTTTYDLKSFRNIQTPSPPVTRNNSRSHSPDPDTFKSNRYSVNGCSCRMSQQKRSDSLCSSSSTLLKSNLYFN